MEQVEIDEHMVLARLLDLPWRQLNGANSIEIWGASKLAHILQHISIAFPGVQIMTSRN